MFLIAPTSALLMKRAKEMTVHYNMKCNPQLSITAKTVKSSVLLLGFKVLQNRFMINPPNFVHANISNYMVCWMFIHGTTQHCLGLSHHNYMDLDTCLRTQDSSQLTMHTNNSNIFTVDTVFTPNTSMVAANKSQL